MNFVNIILKIPFSNIVVLGRSQGSSPALHVSTKFSVRGLVLISAFSSIKNTVKDKLGYLGSILVKNQFDNLAKIRHVKCRVLIIHGTKDSIVKAKQAEMLQDNCCTKCDCLIFKDMTHNKMKTKEWVAQPIGKLARDLNFNFKGDIPIEIPEILYLTPPQGSWS